MTSTTLNQMTFRVHGLEDLPKVARALVEQVPLNRVIALYGKMGAGKTTLIRAVCEALKVKETVTSPTFALVNEYTYASDRKIYHFDFYRINRIEEAFDLGYDEYFYSGELCLVEWPEKIEPLLPQEVVKLVIEVVSETEREIHIQFV